jgi:hypothetical protein
MLHKIDFWPILPSTFEGRLNVGFANFHPGAGLADDVSAHKSKKTRASIHGQERQPPRAPGSFLSKSFQLLAVNVAWL